ncbi:glucuronate isomerase [Tamlana agarivorans]|uniref:Glucuronate isomerase n=1 Tax=Pseudotamlana agarivorans TaxID=481183 RepID=A0ACC5U9Q4_9FLAO|nr:glucuronate isomerase [Tamlana agarivorans]MBU2950963.1 glucuronate isomerase [Tamlana agarivorans]
MASIRSKTFIEDNFLLNSDAAIKLYHDFAKPMPIIDYHNHLSPKQIAENKPMANITDAWLDGDHYKWRAMRAHGVDEFFITGKASKDEKFEKWAQTVPYTLRNPLFHWTHLELKRYFDIDAVLQESNASQIYNSANTVLENKTPAQLLEAMNVEVICTTDDPIDDLKYHKAIAEKGFFTKVYPTFRPDQIFLIDSEKFTAYLEKLEASVAFPIQNLTDVLKAISLRVDFFHEHGCRVSDFGLEQIYAYSFTDEAADAVVKKKLSRETLSETEINTYKSCIQYHVSKLYHKKNWVQQFHLGALRNNNKRLLEQLGADSGCDSMGDNTHAKSMSAFFDRLDYENCLAKTISYNLNPSQNEVFATMMGNFNSGDCAGKMQWGSGWWFLDQKDGMEKQLNALSNLGLLSHFVGMLTDSRSFLSFPRHEYFRRILCDLLAEDLNKGLVPNDIEYLGKMVQDICYYNALNYFNFEK